MLKKVKKCPYCGSLHILCLINGEEVQNEIKGSSGPIVQKPVKKVSVLPNPLDYNKSYRCLECHKDFTI